MPVLSVGEQFPSYSFKAVIPGALSQAQVNKEADYFTVVSSQDLPAGRWRLVFMWPKDFTFVCPTEIAALAEIYDELQERECDVVAVNTDSEYTHFAWRNNETMLKNIPFPLCSDQPRKVLEQIGVINAEGVCDRATFLVDPDNTIQFVNVDAGCVGRNSEEILRQLDALRSGELTACNWQKGAEPLDAFEEMSTQAHLSDEITAAFQGGGLIKLEKKSNNQL